MAQQNKDGTLLFASFALLSAGYLVYGLIPPIVCYFQGLETVATVTRYSQCQDHEGNRYHEHEFTYDGHTITKRASKKYPVGHQRQVLYLSDHSNWVASGSKQDSLWRVIDKNTNGIVLIIMTVILTLCTIATIGSYKEARRRKKATLTS